MESKFHFKNLDSIRTIAFLSTFLAHAFYTESSNIETNKIFVFVNEFREMFSFGVPVFFVLSGFLITYLIFREEQKTLNFSVKKFYLRRIFRIWPVYYLIVIIGFVFFPLFKSIILHEVTNETANPWMYILYLSNFDQIFSGQLPIGVGLGPTWSVSIEEQFYLVWPLFFIGFKQKRFIIPIGLVLISSIVFTMLFNFKSQHTVYSMLYLSMGALFAYVSFFYESTVKKVAQLSSFLPVLALISLITLISNSTSFIFVIFIAFLIGYLIIQQTFGNALNLNRIPLLEFFGKYTYGLYLYHVVCNFIIHILIDDIFKIHETIFSVIVLRPILSLLLAIVLSMLSYHYFESYFLKLKNKFATN
jgi:peptidoglycan/LPS O-acetylase OafA/YrhL